MIEARRSDTEQKPDTRQKSDTEPAKHELPKPTRELAAHPLLGHDRAGFGCGGRARSSARRPKNWGRSWQWRRSRLRFAILLTDQITLYAKIAGYLRSIRVERGDHVGAGQVLGVIESPENDEDVVSARSDAIIKHINAERARRLVTPGIISEADKESAENDERMAQATLQRLSYVSAYESVRAPFDGVITARYVDPGALLPAATGATASAQPIVDVARVDQSRIFVPLGKTRLRSSGPVTTCCCGRMSCRRNRSMRISPVALQRWINERGACSAR